MILPRELKESGIEWIGKVPKQWLVEKVKFHLVRNEPKNPGNQKVLSVYRDYGVIPKDSRDDNHNVTSEDTSKYKYVRKGNLVINKMKAWQGSMGISDYVGIVSPAYFIYHFIDNKLTPKYLHYLFRNCYRDEFRRISGGIREGQWDLSPVAFENTLLLLPPYHEQNQIVNYLKSKCAEIDTLHADIEEQIKTLEEYKRSVISEAVTKGLNPETEMKDSGIEWVGEIPSHWHIHPVYYYFKKRKNKNYRLQEQNLLSLSYGKIIRKDINASGGLLPASFNTYNIVEAGDIIIRPTDLQNDKRSLRTGLVKERGIITSAYIDLMPKGEVNSEYYHYLLHSYDIQKVFYNMGNGVRQGLNYSEFSKLMIFSPPLNEQKQIADYLNSKCSEIEAIIGNKKEQLELLEEYKKSLIYEYVTGKKEVVTNE